jgi:hypothetical protein
VASDTASEGFVQMGDAARWPVTRAVRRACRPLSSSAGRWSGRSRGRQRRVAVWRLAPGRLRDGLQAMLAARRQRGGACSGRAQALRVSCCMRQKANAQARAKASAPVRGCKETSRRLLSESDPSARPVSAHWSMHVLPALRARGCAAHMPLYAPLVPCSEAGDRTARLDAKGSVACQSLLHRPTGFSRTMAALLVECAAQSCAHCARASPVRVSKVRCWSPLPRGALSPSRAPEHHELHQGAAAGDCGDACARTWGRAHEDVRAEC